MKSKILQRGILFLLFFSLFVCVKPQTVLARCEDPCRTGQYSCNDLECLDCLFCHTSPVPPTETPEDVTGKITNPALGELNELPGVRFLGKFLRTGVNFGFFVGTIIFFFTLLAGAVKWISTGGDKTKLEGAQKQITHALVGLVILLSIFAIISVIESIFGISITNISLPTL